MKRLFTLFLVGSLAAATLAGCGKKEPASGQTPVTLNEVAHSIFYAPQYAAIELGYFADEGIDLTLVNGAGADKVMTAMISGGADIGFMGSEASIYTYANGAEDYAVNFAQLTQRAGNFLVGRQPEADFDWNSLKGKKVLGGRAGGRPGNDVTFEHIKGIYACLTAPENKGKEGISIRLPSANNEIMLPAMIIRRGNSPSSLNVYAVSSIVFALERASSDL